MGNRENAGDQYFLNFPNCFQNASFSRSLQGGISWGRVNPFPNKPWFSRVYSTSLLKTQWEKEKLLVTSKFSFPHSVFCPFGELSATFIKFEIVVCLLFQSWWSLKFVVWEKVKQEFRPRDRYSQLWAFCIIIGIRSQEGLNGSALMHASVIGRFLLYIHSLKWNIFSFMYETK